MENQISEKTKRGAIHGVKKADIVLIAVCLLAAVLLGVFLAVHREAGRGVRILHDGIELKRIDLYSEQTDSEAEAGSRYYLITYRDDVAGVETFESRPELPEEIRRHRSSHLTGGLFLQTTTNTRLPTK